MAKLTDVSVRNVRPGPVRREIADTVPLLYLIVQPSGRRRFCLRYRVHGRSRKMTLAAGLTLAAARKVAGDAALDLERGNDPAVTRAAAKARAAGAAANSLRGVCEAYLAREGKKLRTVGQRIRLLRKHVYPVLGDKPIGLVRRGDVVALLDRIEDWAGSRTGDVVLAILRRVMNWHALRDDSYAPVIVRGMGRHSTAAHARSRTLSDEELVRVWRAATAMGGPYGALVRLAVLTGARRAELANMTWDEIEDGLWTLPGERSKSRSPVLRPLSAAALAILADIPRVADCPYVLTANGRGPLHGFAGFKRRLDEVSGVRGWVFHDLRRVVRTRLSQLRVPNDVAELALGHVPPLLRRTYERDLHLDALQAAYEALAQQIERIVDPPKENVIALRGAST
jgi:integrase